MNILFYFLFTRNCNVMLSLCVSSLALHVYCSVNLYIREVQQPLWPGKWPGKYLQILESSALVLISVLSSCYWLWSRSLWSGSWPCLHHWHLEATEASTTIAACCTATNTKRISYQRQVIHHCQSHRHLGKMIRCSRAAVFDVNFTASKNMISVFRKPGRVDTARTTILCKRQQSEDAVSTPTVLMARLLRLDRSSGTSQLLND